MQQTEIGSASFSATATHTIPFPLNQRRPGCVMIILTTHTAPEFSDNVRRLGADVTSAKAMGFGDRTLMDRILPAPPPLFR